jgi:hypothetical protein
VAQKKLKSATDQRKFTLVYNDFLECDLLNYYEKMVFIALKKFADNDTMRAFPSLNTICKVTGISVSQVRRSLDHMKELGVISIEHRTDKDKGHQSNIYTLYDYAGIWNVGSSEKVTEIADEVSEMKLVAELRAKGYIVTKQKGLDVEPTKAQQQALEFNQLDMVNTTTNLQKSQDIERYTLEQILILYDYDVMISDNPYQKHDIDSVMSILHTNLNTTKPTIRIGGEDKPSMAVISKLMKLTYSGIMYAIEKFKEQTERIKNPTSYMLTLLYNAEEQRNLDIANQVQHDMYHWNPPTEE